MKRHYKVITRQAPIPGLDSNIKGIISFLARLTICHTGRACLKFWQKTVVESDFSNSTLRLSRGRLGNDMFLQRKSHRLRLLNLKSVSSTHLSFYMRKA